MPQTTNPPSRMPFDLNALASAKHTDAENHCVRAQCSMPSRRPQLTSAAIERQIEGKGELTFIRQEREERLGVCGEAQRRGAAREQGQQRGYQRDVRGP